MSLLRIAGDKRPRLSYPSARMLTRLSQRLLTLFQLTRMALVFTAIADSQAALLLADKVRTPAGEPLVRELGPGQMITVAVISVGLYGFGMSLNDIIDRRRDRQISPTRPLPSGRVGVMTAHLICALLAAAALGAGVVFRAIGGGDLNLFLVGLTLLLIVFYDVAGKYLVGPGLVTLGLVRFFHALIPAVRLTTPAGKPLSLFSIPRTATGSLQYWPVPHVAAIFHPLWLLNHVTILSTVAYSWEQKRPPLTKRHWFGVLGTLLLMDTLVLAWIARHGPRTPVEDFHLTPGLLLPVAASLAFLGVGFYARRSTRTRREAGQKLMLFGLLWLIVYDACFVAIYVHWLPALLLLLLLPVAWFSVQLMRWWSRIVSVSQRPDFKRAGT
jgi:4-hydroxybenzoate polyprenyltransferase